MSNLDFKVKSISINKSNFKSLSFFIILYTAGDLAKNNPIPQYRGIYHALYNMYRNEGVGSLYRGVGVNMIAGSIANSIFFYVYDEGKTRYGYDP